MNEDATTFAPIPESRPLKDPRAAKDQLLRGWSALKGTMGLPSSGADLERLAVHDLRVHDAVKRDDPAPLPAAVESAEERAARQKAFAAEQAATTGAVITHAPRGPQLVPVLDLPPHLVSSRWPFALGRLKRILEGASPAFAADGSIDWRATCSTCGDPKRAYEYMDLKSWFDFRLTPQTRRHNPFFGMSSRDAGLKFQAEVENLCDRSSGRLGPWWVPK